MSSPIAGRHGRRRWRGGTLIQNGQTAGIDAALRLRLRIDVGAHLGAAAAAAARIAAAVAAAAVSVCGQLIRRRVPST